MNYWICKTHGEAAALIRPLRLKRAMELDCYQVFRGENTLLTVTGGGVVNAAAAVSRLLTLFPPGREDALAQFAPGAGVDGGLFLCNRLPDPAGGPRGLYPCMSYNDSSCNDLSEELPLSAGREPEAAVFQTALRFLEAHRIFTFATPETPGSGGFCEAAVRADSWISREKRATANAGFSHGYFPHVYVEERAAGHPLTKRVLAALPESRVIPVGHYKDVFCGKRQNYAAQKRNQALILAAGGGRTLYPGSPLCDSFGHSDFYYHSAVKNCPYDCEYCYLQAVYPSGNVVINVDFEESLAEVERQLAVGSLYVCVSYDTDLLALERLTGFLGRWLELAAKRESLKLEIRTKSADYAAVAGIKPTPNVVFAWSLSPGSLCERFERRCPPLAVRLAAAGAAARDGWPVRLCFDPLLYTESWREDYAACVDQAFAAVNADSVHSVSIGVFRAPAKALRKISALRPGSPLFAPPAVPYPPELANRMTCHVKDLVSKHVGLSKIWIR